MGDRLMRVRYPNRSASLQRVPRGSDGTESFTRRTRHQSRGRREQNRIDRAGAIALGWLSVQVQRRGCGIAIDRKPLAYGMWSGEVPVGEHELQIYKPAM